MKVFFEPGAAALRSAAGFIDTAQVLLWQRQTDGMAELWAAGNPPSAIGSTCRPLGKGTLRAIDLETGLRDFSTLQKLPASYQAGSSDRWRLVATAAAILSP